MHTFDEQPAVVSAGASSSQEPWYREMQPYHWFVLVVAALGWLFDCLDQQLFVLTRQPAMKELIASADTSAIDKASTIATSIFLVGWASGGLIFGVLGDRIGRARTMIITILMYSIFTGLSALSQSFWDFAVYRFLTGLGVGGEFAVGVALVAEVMPDRARPFALALLQALSAVGNITAALLNMGMGALVESGLVTNVWRPLYVVGAVPALLALVIRRRLKEPERWQHAAQHAAKRSELGSYRELFSHPRWRRHALLGLVMAFCGVVGLWAIGFYSMDLVGNVLSRRFEQEGFAQEQIAGRVAWWKGITSLMNNVGAFFGMYVFGMVTQRIGRRPAFAIAFLAAFASTVAVFALLREFWQIFVLVPIMGFCQLSLFAGYAVYFPELFPTRLRSTGTSFCYNVGRFVSALGPFLLGHLIGVFRGTPEPLRYAGLVMCAVFLIGLIVLPFVPETKGRPLPE
ncbi:MAG: MFS transporter [Pirellulaceae bacterium]|nr:MAG: MFS transporter [Pirellulaceae bacterium]